MTKKVLAVIPARGGSKGIPRKNLRLLNEKPLIFYVLQNAIKTSMITDVVVTSDDEDILDYCSQFSVHLRTRPSLLATDAVTLDPVVYDATTFLENKLGKKYNLVITLQPTSPLLFSKTLGDAIDYFIKNNVDTLLPVIDATHLYWKANNQKITPDYVERLNRQWLPKKYKETGAFLITKREFVTEQSRFGFQPKVFVLNEIEGIDIDSPVDWLVVESLVNRLKIVLVVNGNKTIGMGHVYRSISVANRFLGHEIRFITYSSDEKTVNFIKNNGYRVQTVEEHSVVQVIKSLQPFIIINDILDTSAEYIKELRNSDYFVVNFEDLGEGANEANLVFNALYDRVDSKPQHYFGYKYECVNEKFLLRENISFSEKVKVVLLTFGGIDQNNLTLRLSEILCDIGLKLSIEKVIVVLGMGYQHSDELKSLKPPKDLTFEIHQNVSNMPKLMVDVDLAVTSNGRTVYELAAMGIPTISIAQNDRETLHSFSRFHKGVKYMGMAYSVDNNAITSEIKNICTDSKLRRQMYTAQINDGKIIKKGMSAVIDLIWRSFREYSDEKITAK